MPAWSSIPRAKALVFALAAQAALAALAAGVAPSIVAPALGAAASQDPCRAGKPSARVTAFFSRRLLPAKSGLPKDDALRAEREALFTARGEARDYFLEHDHPILSPLRLRFTLLVPPELEEKLGLGVPVAMSPSALAIRYRELLWRHYIERFTTVEEAPGRDPDELRFKVSLNLELFCRYRQNVRDLVSR
jgi:hypothetical protein